MYKEWRLNFAQRLFDSCTAQVVCLHLFLDILTPFSSCNSVFSQLSIIFQFTFDGLIICPSGVLPSLQVSSQDSSFCCSFPGHPHTQSWDPYFFFISWHWWLKKSSPLFWVSLNTTPSLTFPFQFPARTLTSPVSALDFFFPPLSCWESLLLLTKPT